MYNRAVRGGATLIGKTLRSGVTAEKLNFRMKAANEKVSLASVRRFEGGRGEGPGKLVDIVAADVAVLLLLLMS